MPCGFDLQRTRTELARSLEDPRWRKLPAMRRDQVFAVDGNAYFNRPGPRLVDSAEILAALLHPGECGELLPEGATARISTAGRGIA
jgi:iron complex transport system substrate-binding protein